MTFQVNLHRFFAFRNEKDTTDPTGKPRGFGEQHLNKFAIAAMLN